jgi:hypothetical protein
MSAKARIVFLDSAAVGGDDLPIPNSTMLVQALPT